jgi:hypothetical protein
MSLKQWNIIHSLVISTGLFVLYLFDVWWPVLIIAFLSGGVLWISQWYIISHLKPLGG